MVLFMLERGPRIRSRTLLGHILGESGVAFGGGIELQVHPFSMGGGGGGRGNFFLFYDHSISNRFMLSQASSRRFVSHVYSVNSNWPGRQVSSPPLPTVCSAAGKRKRKGGKIGKRWLRRSPNPYPILFLVFPFTSTIDSRY